MSHVHEIMTHWFKDKFFSGFPVISLNMRYLSTQNIWSFVWKTLLDDRPKPHECKNYWSPQISLKSMDSCMKSTDNPWNPQPADSTQNERPPLAEDVNPLHFNSWLMNLSPAVKLCHAVFGLLHWSKAICW